MNGNFKKIAIAVVAVIGLLLILAAKTGLSASSNVSKLPTAHDQAVTKTQNDQIEILSTNPSPLDESTVTPTQTIEITFSDAAQNVPELKLTIEPTIDLNLQLSDDRKTLKISPKDTFGLEQGYTLKIPSDAKFDGNKTLGRDLEFHFKTISYSGV